MGTVNDPPTAVFPPVRVRLMAGSGDERMAFDGGEPKSVVAVAAAVAAARL